MNIVKIGSKCLIGMVHCLPLPGTPNFDGNTQKILDQAVNDAINLEKAGVNAIMIENMGDTPFGITLNTAQLAALSAASALVKQAVKIPVGVDAAFNDVKAALAIVKIIGGDFVRVPVFVDTVEFFGGIMEPCARECMYYRKELQAENIKIFADIQVKYTNMLLPHITLEQSAKTAESCGADAIIVTGLGSGYETPLEAVTNVKKAVKIPVIIGSGITAENINEQLTVADGAIIGSSLKENGIMTNPISYELTKKLTSALIR